MKMPKTTRVVVLLAATVTVAGGACSRPESGGEAEEPLVTEEIGPSIDADLSTAEDPRGPRWADSGNVLPAGFPAGLPLASGFSVVDSGAAESGESFVVFGAPSVPADLLAGWAPLVEGAGWKIDRVSETHWIAAKGEQSVWAIASPLGSGSRLRIVYRVVESAPRKAGG